MPTVSATSSTTAASQQADSSTRIPVQTLGQDDFLKLLVTQMTQQDPMNPMKDTEFISQMASFSSLEQSKTMSQDMASLRATTLIGETVTVSDSQNDTGYVTGMVTGVTMINGAPQIIVNGSRYDLSAVAGISPTVLSPDPVDNSGRAPINGSTTP